jgi:hypothetical protein
MNDVALIIIYNHQYNDNIEILEQIYKDRFSNIYHLVPFYSGKKANVIAVYDCSYYFQGYVAQGLKSFFNERYLHYFFIADDLILNPVISETNYNLHLNLEYNTCFIPRLSTINESKDYWASNLNAYQFNKMRQGVEVMNQLPDYSKALQLLKIYGLENKPLLFNQIWGKPNIIKSRIKKIIGKRLYSLIRNKELLNQKYNLSYPLVRSYSDIFVISSDSIHEFCHYCGIFSVLQLFVELAVPTSLVFSAKKIVTEKDLLLRGKALWTKEEHLNLNQYNNKLQNLLNNFPLGQLYIHPIKLSKWETK